MKLQNSPFRISDDWFLYIKKDIKNKYHVDFPKFLINGVELTELESEKWTQKYVSTALFWVKYKLIKNSIFELKPFSPDPNDLISKELIDNFINNVPILEKISFFSVAYVNEWNYALFESLSWYDKNEVKSELLYLFRIGRSKISFLELSIEKTHKVIHRLLVECDSIENMLKTGYLKLEYFD